MKKLVEQTLALLLRNTPLIMFVLLFVCFGALSEGFLEYKNFENIVKQASYIGIVAVGMTFVLLTAGIDLSVGSNMYLSAAVAGLLISRLACPVWLGLMACLGCGTLFGAVNAVAVARLKIIPFVATLGTMVAGRGVALMLTRSRAVAFPDSVRQLGALSWPQLRPAEDASPIGIPVPIWIFAAVVLAAALILRRTMIGRQIYAVGNDREAADKAGIHTGRVLAFAYIACGVLAALGGFVSVAQQGNLDPSFGETREFDAIAAAVLGGTSLFGGIGNVFPGTVLGAVLLRMIPAGLVSTQVQLYLQPLVLGAIIFAAVLIDSIRNTLLARLRRRHIRIEEPG